MHDVFRDFSCEPIIITGCARSGTSLIAGIVSACGAWMGKCTGATPWNRKGQFENEAIRDRLTKPFLKSIGCDPMGQLPLPDPGVCLRDPSWKSRVLNIIHNEGYDGTGPWAFKGAKATLIWPVWDHAFPRARWVIVRRKDEKIVDSCVKTRFMHKRKTREDWQEWVDYHKERFQDIAQTVTCSCEVWTEDIVGDYSAACTLVEALGLHWNEERVSQFVTPDLWNG